MEADELRDLIITSLQQQGFNVEGSRILPPTNPSKESLRQLHAVAVRSRLEKAREGLQNYESKLISRFASGREVQPTKIKPRLVEVKRRSHDEILFRYACLHWSIPVSSGYGRRLRFLVIDESNNKLMGLFGLGDPVFSLAPRDHWVGWDKEDRRARLHHVLDAFVLGSVPPYSSLLCGKLIALLVASDEVRKAFLQKYGGRSSVITERTLDGSLALITTTSALGRSSLYNRLSFQNRLLFCRVGYTRGTGDFHFNNGIYHHLWSHAAQHCRPTAKQEKWGKGFRNRRETVRKCLASLGLPAGYLSNLVQREIFVVPMAANSREFLRGEDSNLNFFEQPAEAVFQWFRERWLLARAERDRRYVEFDPKTLTLWERRG
ncbi:MAG TPA: hypothetical protein DCY27_12350 [Desulfobacterales bacterium]|nr:hypothetical protein [Desulfobacterales bacterium]